MNSYKGNCHLNLLFIGIVSDVLEALSTWILNHNDICRPQDICSLILTLAMLNYEPSNASKLYEVIIFGNIKTLDFN